MTGVTTGQTALPTATDSDDAEQFLTVSLTTALQALANLFESATGHDHTGAGKGKPIGSAGLASGIILTSPHMTTAVVDSGGLTVTAGGLTVTAGTVDISAGPLTVGGGTYATAGTVRVANNSFVAWRNNGNTGNILVGVDTTDRMQFSASNLLAIATTVGAAGGASALPANPLAYWRVVLNGTEVKIPYYNA